MRNHVILFIFICLGIQFCAEAKPLSIAVPIIHAVTDPSPVKSKQSATIRSVKLKDIEKIIGKKLSIKEKIIFRLLQKRMTKRIGDTELAKRKKLGIISLICGICSLVFVFIPGVAIITPGLAIAAIILGILSLKGNTNVPGIIGMSLGITYLIILTIAIIAIASWGWY